MKKYYTEGVCATEIDFDIEDGILIDVKFEGGCDGNLKAVSTLVKGMKVEDVIRKLKGTTCGNNQTSCVDQLTIALEQEVG